MDPISIAQILIKSRTKKITTYLPQQARANSIREGANNLGYLTLEIIKIVQLSHTIT